MIAMMLATFWIAFWTNRQQGTLFLVKTAKTSLPLLQIISTATDVNWLPKTRNILLDSRLLRNFLVMPKSRVFLLV